jgi:hypothetical protein
VGALWVRDYARMLWEEEERAVVSLIVFEEVEGDDNKC